MIDFGIWEHQGVPKLGKTFLIVYFSREFNILEIPDFLDICCAGRWHRLRKQRWQFKQWRFKISWIRRSWQLKNFADRRNYFSELSSRTPSQVPDWLESGSGNLTKRTASLELSPADDIYLLPNSTRLNKDKSRLINNRANAVTKEKVAENIGSQLRWKWLFSDPIKGLFWSQWILGYGNPTDHFKLLSKLNVQDGLVEY